MKNRIKELRKKGGYRQEDLAEALGVSRQTIIAIENNKYNPTLELAMKMALWDGHVQMVLSVHKKNLLEPFCLRIGL